MRAVCLMVAPSGVPAAVVLWYFGPFIQNTKGSAGISNSTKGAPSAKGGKRHWWASGKAVESASLPTSASGRPDTETPKGVTPGGENRAKGVTFTFLSPTGRKPIAGTPAPIDGAL